MEKQRDIHLKISKRNAAYQVLSALKNNRKKRCKAGEIFIEGIESIKQAVAAQLIITRIIYQHYATLSDWSRALLAEYTEAKQIEMTEDLYRELCDKQSPAEIIITARFTIKTLSDPALPDKPFILILDRPGDKGNLGSIIRTANALQVDLIIIIGHAVDILDPKVIRTSLGAVFFTPVVQAQSQADFETWLTGIKKKTGLLLLGTDSGGDVALHDCTTGSAVAVILGNEAKGISQRLKEICDIFIKIPITGNVNSLNVACAGSILLWHFRNLYNQAGPPLK